MTLLVAMELSNMKWLPGFHNGNKNRRKSIEARARKRFPVELVLAKEKLGLPLDAKGGCCCGAGSKRLRSVCEGFVLI